MNRIHAFCIAAIVGASLALVPACKTTDRETTTLYLVRHAEKAVDGTEDPDLSEAGKQRALKLADMLKEENVERLYATSYKRTQQTLRPLADAFGLQVQIYNHREGASIDSMIRDCTGKVAVIAGHSNSTPRLANRLIGKETYPDIDESDYTMMWKVIKKKANKTQHKVIRY